MVEHTAQAWLGHKPSLRRRCELAVIKPDRCSCNLSVFNSPISLCCEDSQALHYHQTEGEMDRRRARVVLGGSQQVRSRLAQHSGYALTFGQHAVCNRHSRWCRADCFDDGRLNLQNILVLRLQYKSEAMHRNFSPNSTRKSHCNEQVCQNTSFTWLCYSCKIVSTF